MNTNDHILETDKIKKKAQYASSVWNEFHSFTNIASRWNCNYYLCVYMGQCEHTTARIPKTFQINFSGVLCNMIGCVYTVYNFRKTWQN